MSELDCRLIYRQAFCDPDTVFEDKLFKNCFSYCKTCEEKGRTVSMLFALPCDIRLGETLKNAVYIYAAATLKEYRKRGYMTRLIETVKNSSDLVFLVPEKEELIPFYKKLGFCEFKASTYKQCNKCVEPKGGFIPLSVGEKEKSEYEFRAMYRSDGKLSLDGLYFPFLMLN